MAIRTYVNGAWEDIEELQSPEVNGAREEAEQALTYEAGAWEEAWSAVKFMTKKSDDITTGMLQIQDEGLTFDYLKFASEWEGKVAGTLGGGGTIVLYLDGTWTNPVISFDWTGGFLYQSTDRSYWIRVAAGEIKIHTRNTTGTESAKTAVQSVGSTLNGSEGGNVSEDSGHYEGTISGTFNRLGLEVYVAGYGDSLIGTSTIEITNLRIDGRKIGFPADAAFDRQSWDYV